jgi:adenylate cyclase
MKERAAVQAARDIVRSIPALPVSGDGADRCLSVGVGIATGRAFVGNIESADRAIWTALGNPVNLAARLQAMTRDLDASVAIDYVTFRRTGETCADFVRYGDVAIRGRTAVETVHALPLTLSWP